MNPVKALIRKSKIYNDNFPSSFGISKEVITDKKL